MLYPDEGHGFARPENRIDFNARAERFLAEYLGGRYERMEGDSVKGSTELGVRQDSPWKPGGAAQAFRMRRHTRRQHSRTPRENWLRIICGVLGTALGGVALVMALLVLPGGKFLLTALASIFVVYVLIQFGYFAGRAAAKMHNTIAVVAARSQLQKAFHKQQEGYSARLFDIRHAAH